ncbi:MAG: CBS domain-containing protein [Blastocatellales bacterium]
MQVKEVMSEPAITVNESASLAEIADLMLKEGIGCVPVVNNQGLISGIITESDFAAKEKGVPFSTFRAPQIFGKWMGNSGVEQMYQAAREMKAEEIMKSKVVTLTENDPLEKAIELLLKHNVNRLPVVREGKPVGIVSRHDLLRLMLQKKAG